MKIVMYIVTYKTDLIILDLQVVTNLYETKIYCHSHVSIQLGNIYWQ